jgi:hypothetical protein
MITSHLWTKLSEIFMANALSTKEAMLCSGALLREKGEREEHEEQRAVKVGEMFDSVCISGTRIGRFDNDWQLQCWQL